MMRTPETRKPREHGASRKGPDAGSRIAFDTLYRKPKAPRLPADWRLRLPDPESYYRKHAKKLSAPNSSGWAQGRCPFHDDHEASLSVHLSGERGGWKCFAGCGHGDMVSFHERLTGLKFPNSARDLIGLKVTP